MKLQKPPTGTLDITKVKFPCYGSIKYDGFRLAKVGGRTVLNSGRELDNNYVRGLIEQEESLNDHDGELVMLPLNDNACFNRCQSAFRRESGEPDFRYVVFDRIVDGTFQERWLDWPVDKIQEYPSWVMVDVPVLLTNREELDAFVAEVLSQGHEGVILRNAESYYKEGRATMKNQEVLRIKPMEDDEAIIEDFECEYENVNEAEEDLHGHTKRSSSKAGKVPKDTLGTLICSHPTWGLLSISGFTDEEALEIWNNKEKYLGQYATFRYQACGSLEKPRLPKFKGVRYINDLSEE